MATSANKYHVAAKADRTYNDVVYDSKKEAEYAAQLDLRQRAGEVWFWTRQVPFRLPGTTYRVDFLVFYPLPEDIELETPNHRWKLVEVKGYWTPEAKRKMKLFKATYPGVDLTIA